MVKSTNELPKWLPEALRVHVLAKLEVGGLGILQSQLIQLASREEMQHVWTSLVNAKADPELLIEFFEYVRLHPLVMYPELLTNSLTLSEQRKHLKSIIKHSQSLLDNLALLGGTKSHPELGVSNISPAWALIGMNLLAVDGVEYTASEFTTHLKVLQEAATLTLNALPKRSSNKPGAKNAKQIKLIKDISRFIQQHFQRPLNQAVATTVNVVLDLPNDQVTEDLVRKLTKSSS